jgi:hypothetical protein
LIDIPLTITRSYIFTNNTRFPADFNYLANPVKKTINLRPDAFSPRLGQECQPFERDPPSVQLFDPKKVAIVSNGRCASSCSLFSITMAKEEGAKTVVVGGRNIIPQSYCGTVGGQSTSYSVVDSEVKTAGLKSDPLAPPDFITNSVQGITWRLGFGIWNKNEPEEWQARPADVNFPLTADTYVFLPSLRLYDLVLTFPPFSVSTTRLLSGKPLRRRCSKREASCTNNVHNA